METWKTNLDETKKRYIDWWNHKGKHSASCVFFSPLFLPTFVASL